MPNENPQPIMNEANPAPTNNEEDNQTLSYSDDTLKAISSMQMYSNIFNAYSGVFQYQPSSEVNDFETPSNEQEQNNEISNNGTEENPVE